MRIKSIYKKNLKMTVGKIASQIAHAVKNLGITPEDSDIIVLSVSNKKFYELIRENRNCYIQKDKGLSEVDVETETAAAWVVKDEEMKNDVMKEQLISFETAKLCPQNAPVAWNLCGDKPIVMSPTQSLLQKWLREECNIYIWVFCLVFSKKFAVRVETDIEHGKTYRTFDTWEDALEKGLQKGLKSINVSHLR